MLRNVVLVACVAACMAVPLTDTNRPVFQEDIINDVNRDVNSTWVARESPVFKGMSMSQFRKLLGLRTDREYSHVPVKSHKYLALELPEEFNAYEAWPKYMHPIRDQAHW
jgi:hypothetical protein